MSWHARNQGPEYRTRPHGWICFYCSDIHPYKVQPGERHNCPTLRKQDEEKKKRK